MAVKAYVLIVTDPGATKGTEDGVTAPAPTVNPGTLVLLETETGSVTLGVEVTAAFPPGADYIAS